MNTTRIRTLAGTDVRDVLAIWNRALKRDPMTEGRFVAGILADPDYWAGEDSGFFVATRDGRPAGFLRAIIRRLPNDRMGIEPEIGWIPIVAVDPDHQRAGIGTALMEAALAYFRRHGRRHIWVCGGSGSAPGYIIPGVDKDLYQGGVALFMKAGFKANRESESMGREIVDFEVDKFRAEAWAVGGNVKILSLVPELAQDFVEFLADSFPGDWNTAARAKIRAGLLHEVLVAIADGEVVGYCQWEGEHFGPFGVKEEMRGQRIGAKLFVEAVQRIREGDGRTVWFNWAEEKAAKFYRRFGLKATRRFVIFEKEL